VEDKILMIKPSFATVSNTNVTHKTLQISDAQLLGLAFASAPCFSLVTCMACLQSNEFAQKNRQATDDISY
jgi:hypothetical protein